MADETENRKSIIVKGFRSAMDGERLYLKEDRSLERIFTCPGDCHNLTVSTSFQPEELAIKMH